MTLPARLALERIVETELARLPGVEYEVMEDTGRVAEAGVIDRYDAILAFALRFEARSFEGVERLAIIARWGVGYDMIDVPACTRAGVILAITPEAIRRPVAEGVLALIFAVTKRIVDLDRLVRSGGWRTALPENMICIEGRTLGSVGFGNIAGEMFKMARGLGFGRLVACDPYGSAERAEQLGVELTDLDTVMRESDFVTVNCMLNEETRGLIDARALSLMKPDAYLINTARGPIVNESALYEALRDRRIAGAGLDVFEQEPPAPDNPLFKLENVVLAPHAVAWTEECKRDNSLYACRNVRAVYDGEAPVHVVNREVLGQERVQARLAARRSQ
jgi:phosphoglycerate dehydrogenase-like enzyme